MAQPNPRPNNASLVGASMGSALFTAFVNHPFFRIKHLLQTRTINPAFVEQSPVLGALDAFLRIPREEGIMSYWRGFFPGLLHTVFQRYFHFMGVYLYQTMNKEDFKEFHLEQLPLLAFGAASYSILYPLQFANVRLNCDYGPEHTRRFLGMNDCLVQMYKAEGIKGFYKGLVPGLLGVMLFQPIFFTGAKLLRNPQAKDPAASQIKMRTLAVAVKALLYPLETIRNKMIMQTSNGRANFTDFMGCVKSTFEAEGLMGFYRGFQVELVLFIPGIILAGYLASQHKNSF